MNYEMTVTFKVTVIYKIHETIHSKNAWTACYIGFARGMIFLRARISYQTFDFQSSNFTFFWLSGRMLIEGENPYDEKQYLAGHVTHGITWQPNKIFPYPLPLAIFFIPLGLLSLPAAYITWQVITLIIVAMTIFLLLNHWEESAQRLRLFPFLRPCFSSAHYSHSALWSCDCIAGFGGDPFLLENIVSASIAFHDHVKPAKVTTIFLLAAYSVYAPMESHFSVANAVLRCFVIGMIQCLRGCY